MKIKDPELDKLEREARAITRYLDSSNCLACSENEATYLMSGHATELIDKVVIHATFPENKCVKIYGVVAKERVNGRYCWVYAHYDYRLWKCHSIPYAYEIAQKVRERVKIEQKIHRLNRRLASNHKLPAISNN
ncbi:hypothetical protein [Flavobacterium sp. XGLA_31]|uniref:hypothetical protein n=1 Tax=Flavobacterium sp. XGLA_31 TaxID=3447666 RepID=UPI003F2A0149